MTDDGDRALEEAVAEMLRTVDPVPPEVVAGAHVAFAMRAIDAELATLAEELDESDLAGVRGGGARSLTFRAAGTEVIVEVGATGRTATMTGQVTPPDGGTVTAEWPGGAVSAPVDDRGRFVVDDVRIGPVRLRLDLAGRRPVVTDWLQA